MLLAGAKNSLWVIGGVQCLHRIVFALGVYCLFLGSASATCTEPTNVALAANGATASASSVFSGFAASGAINGDRKGLFVWQDGYWSTAAAGFPAWLEVQFNGSKTITEIDVVTQQDNYNAPIEPTESMTFSVYGLTSYEVQYWTGSAWATIPGGTVSGNNKAWKKFTFAPITTTKIRVWATGSPDSYSRLTEVEAWTGPSPAPRYNLALGAALPLGKLSVIYLNDAFFQPTVGGTTSQFLPNRISEEDSRALTILHELAHAIWKSFHAGPFSAMTSDELDRKIFDDCFDGGKTSLQKGVAE